MNYLLVEGSASVSCEDRTSPTSPSASVCCLELLAFAAQYLIFASFAQICEGLKVPELRTCIHMVNRCLQNLTFSEGKSGMQPVKINLFSVGMDRSDDVQRDS